MKITPFVFNNLAAELSWPGRRAVEIQSLSSVLFIRSVSFLARHSCSVLKLLKNKGESSLDAVRLASGQTLYRLMNNRLGTLQMMWSLNPGSEGMTDHSTGFLMLHYSRTCLSQRDSSGDMAFESES